MTNNDNDKEIRQYLIIDWKDETTRTRKSKPTASDLGTNEVYAELEIDVHIPEVDVATIAAKVDVPEARVEAANLQALSDEELPDWTDTATEVFENVGGDYLATDGYNTNDVVDIVTARALTEMSTRPDPEKVQDYVHKLTRREINRD